MAASGLEVFDKTLQTTHRWLNETGERTGSDRQLAWHALGAVLHALRDRVPLELAVHVGAQLPLLVRGLYYDGWRPSEQPGKARTLEGFLARVADGLATARPVDPRDAAQAVFRVLSHHLDPGQVGKLVRRCHDRFTTSGPRWPQCSSPRTTSAGAAAPTRPERPCCGSSGAPW
jgi:uncharacterized protein (DUF2267 family)